MTDQQYDELMNFWHALHAWRRVLLERHAFLVLDIIERHSVEIDTYRLWLESRPVVRP